MSESNPRYSLPPPPQGSANVVLSLAGKIVTSVLALWQARVTELQTLSRLLSSLVQAPGTITAERRAQLGSLLSLELRAMAQLPRPDFWSLVRSTAEVQQSGAVPVNPDVSTTERELMLLRDSLGRHFVETAELFADRRDDELPPRLEAAARDFERLGRLLALLEAVLHRRVEDPVTVAAAIVERAAKACGATIALTGPANTPVLRARGLIHLLSEVMRLLGARVQVAVEIHGHALVLTLMPGVAAPAEANGAALLQLAAYLLGSPLERQGAGWRVALPVAG
jgi:hypothetical protein